MGCIRICDDGVSVILLRHRVRGDLVTRPILRGQPEAFRPVIRVTPMYLKKKKVVDGIPDHDAYPQ
jgi:hypothetical protein